jgi:hypothetical protein
MTSTDIHVDPHGHRDGLVTATGGVHLDEPPAPETLEPGALAGISGGTAQTRPKPGRLTITVDR